MGTTKGSRMGTAKGSAPRNKAQHRTSHPARACECVRVVGNERKVTLRKMKSAPKVITEVDSTENDKMMIRSICL
jgi:hypothetical protein